MGPIGIGYAVHRGDLHDVGEGDHFGEFAALGIELVPCADDAGVGVVEHGVVPVLARDVVEVVAREAGVDDSGVAGEDVAREVLDDLIVGAAVLLVADQLEGGDDVLGHLREGRTRREVVPRQHLVGRLVGVGVFIQKIARAGRGRHKTGQRQEFYAVSFFHKTVMLKLEGHFYENRGCAYSAA